MRIYYKEGDYKSETIIGLLDYVGENIIAISSKDERASQIAKFPSLYIPPDLVLESASSAVRHIIRLGQMKGLWTKISIHEDVIVDQWIEYCYGTLGVLFDTILSSEYSLLNQQTELALEQAKVEINLLWKKIKVWGNIVGRHQTPADFCLAILLKHLLEVPYLREQTNPSIKGWVEKKLFSFSKQRITGEIDLVEGRIHEPPDLTKIQRLSHIRTIAHSRNSSNHTLKHLVADNVPLLPYRRSQVRSFHFRTPSAQTLNINTPKTNNTQEKIMTEFKSLEKKVSHLKRSIKSYKKHSRKASINEDFCFTSGESEKSEHKKMNSSSGLELLRPKVLLEPPRKQIYLSNIEDFVQGRVSVKLEDSLKVNRFDPKKTPPPPIVSPPKNPYLPSLTTLLPPEPISSISLSLVPAVTSMEVLYVPDTDSRFLHEFGYDKKILGCLDSSNRGLPHKNMNSIDPRLLNLWTILKRIKNEDARESRLRSYLQSCHKTALFLIFSGTQKGPISEVLKGTEDAIIFDFFSDDKEQFGSLAFFENGRAADLRRKGLNVVEVDVFKNEQQQLIVKIIDQVAKYMDN